MSFVQKIKALADIYQHPQSYKPSEYAIWFQHQDDLRAEVNFVNNKYKFKIFNTAHGMCKLVLDGNEDTLALAKKAVFKYFEEQK